MIHTYGTAFHRSYFYYLIAFFAFAIYSIWGQIGMHTALATIETTKEVKVMVTNFIPLLGLPFLIISWIMLVKMAYALMNISAPKGEYLIHSVIFLILMAMGSVFYGRFQELLTMGQPSAFVFIALILGTDVLYTLIFSAIVLNQLKKLQPLERKRTAQFTMLLFGGLLVRGVALTFYAVGPWILGLLILFYFLTNLPPIWFMKNHSDSLFRPIGAEVPNTDKKQFLYQKYQITRREQEIIDQLCQGKTNQQIADTLFISLQTVKDHTHRIYNKVGINSRMKLVQLVNG